GEETGQHARPAEPVSLEGLSVLVVDDNPTNRRILEELLSNWRMRPTGVAGGTEALVELRRAAATGTPLPLGPLDAQMPGMDGFDLAQHIRAHPELVGATIMMLSSADRTGDTARCRALGIRAYLTKPLKQSELLNMIQAALRQAASGSAPAAEVEP